MIDRWCISLGILIYGQVFGQQDPQITQYMFNRLYMNPAYAGSSENVNSIGLFRNQWTDFTNPMVSGLISTDAPIKKLKGALGFTGLYDQFSVEKTLNTKISYSYFFRFEKTTFSIGADAGYLYKQIVNKFISNANGSVTQGKTYNGFAFPDVGIGIYFYSKRFYAGLSSTHITSPKIKMELFNYSLARHYYLIAGKKITITENLLFEPSFLFKSDLVSSALDLNINISYKNCIFIGGGIRPSDAIIFLLGGNVSNFRLSYSFDYGISPFKTYLGNSHEIVLGYSIKSKKEKSN